MYREKGLIKSSRINQIKCVAKGRESQLVVVGGGVGFSVQRLKNKGEIISVLLEKRVPREKR